MAMDNEQGNQDDAVSEKTLSDYYDLIRIDQETIEAELQGKEQFEQRPVPEYYRRPVRRRSGSIFEGMRLETPQKEPRRFGYDLLKHRPADTLTRYQTLCDLEQQAGPSYDHGYLVGSACWLIESEINTLLAAPAKREIGEVLLKHLALKQKKIAYACLEDCLTGQKPVMMGTESIIL